MPAHYFVFFKRGEKMFDAIITTPIGSLGLECPQGTLISLQFLDDHVIPFPRKVIPKSVQVIIKKIHRYFEKPQDFDLPLLPQGTEFQRKVWQYLQKIPLGQTRTYGECAKKLKTSARAIGMACRTNPLPVVIPCHRVVGAKDLGGYCGQVQGEVFAIKQWLLAHEHRIC
jgi:methylated-DNA-[protein]-cysteine S-methyltransferase